VPLSPGLVTPLSTSPCCPSSGSSATSQLTTWTGRYLPHGPRAMQCTCDVAVLTSEADGGAEESSELRKDQPLRDESPLRSRDMR
jgi:hypothetical protein